MESEIHTASLPAPLLLSAVVAAIIWEAGVLAALFASPRANAHLAVSIVILPALPFLLARGKALFVVILSLIVIIPSVLFRRDPIPIGLNNWIVWGAVLVVIGYWSIGLSLGRFGLPDSDMDRLMLLFLFFVIVGILVGVMNGHPLFFLSSEIAPFLYFGLFFFVRTALRDHYWPRVIMWCMIAAAVVVSFEYLAILSSGPSIVGLGRRVQARQEIGYLIAFSFLLAHLLLGTGRRSRITYFCLLPLVLVGAAISQTRGIWISMFVILVAEFLISIILSQQKKLVTKRMLPVVLVILSTVAAGLMVIAIAVGPLMLLELVSRFSSIRALGGIESVQWRISMNLAVLQRCLTHPLLGSGVGSSVWYKFLGGHFLTNWVDNSYLLLVWKFGLPGLSIYLALVFLVFRKSAYIFRHDVLEHSRLFALGVMGLYSGLMVYGLATGVLLKYRFNLIWITLLALTQNRYESLVLREKTVPALKPLD